MSGYEWNYTVLELVDYIEENLSSKTDSDDNWKHFKMFCSLRGLNWRVLKKMIEYSVVQPFNSEADIIQHEAFKSLELKTETTGETIVPAVAERENPLDINFLDYEPMEKKVSKKEEDLVDIFK